MQWSNEVWLAILAAFIIGVVIGYVVLRATNVSMQKQHQLESDLKVAHEKIDEQREQLEKHFEQSASLLATLAEDYKKLYTHLATTSQTLLPESAEKIAFFQQPRIEENAPDDKESQPKDYSEGSSGILKM